MIHALLATLSLTGLGVFRWLLVMPSAATDFPPNAPDVLDVPLYTLDTIGLV